MIRNILVLVCLLVTASAQAERDYEYKCWLTLVGGGSFITFQNLETQGAHSQARGLLEEIGSITLDETSYTIAQVHECVPITGTFISVAARQLDSVTVR